LLLDIDSKVKFRMIKNKMDKNSFLNKLRNKASSAFKKNNPKKDTVSDKNISKEDSSQSKTAWQVLVKGKNFLSKFSYLWIILLFAFLTRLYGLGGLGANGQEIKNIDRILAMGNPGEFLGSGVSTNLYYALQNIWGRIFGFSLTNMRLLSVLLGILGLYVFYKFTEEWFNRKLAYISTFLLSISSFHILMSRNISHEILYPVIIISALYVLTLAYRYKMWQYFVLAGALLGLGFYTSETTFILALLFLISGIYFYTKNKKFLTSFVKEKALAIFAVLIVSLPFLYSISLNPENLLSQFTYKPNVIFNNAKIVISSLFFSAPEEYMYTVGTDKVLDPYVAITFLFGLIYISMRIKRRKFYFLFAWLVFFTIIILLDSTFSLGNFVYLLPVIFLLSARIQTYVLDKWFETFPFNRFARITMILGIGFLFALSLTYNYKKVFLAWEKYPDRKLAYNVSPASLNLTNEKIYIYKYDIPKDIVGIILKADKNDLIEATKIEDIPDREKVNVATSAEEISSVKSAKKDVNWKEYKGKNIVLLKGE